MMKDTLYLNRKGRRLFVAACGLTSSLIAPVVPAAPCASKQECLQAGIYWVGRALPLLDNRYVDIASEPSQASTSADGGVAVRSMLDGSSVWPVQNRKELCKTWTQSSAPISTTSTSRAFGHLAARHRKACSKAGPGAAEGQVDPSVSTRALPHDRVDEDATYPSRVADLLADMSDVVRVQDACLVGADHPANDGIVRVAKSPSATN